MAKNKIDITTHVLVPEHSKVSEKEKQELLKRYHITIKELPMILSKDPVLANMQVKDGDLIKITRQSRTAGTAVFYRRVVNA